MRRVLTAGIVVAVAIAFLALRVDWREFSSAFGRVEWLWLIGAALSMLTAVMIRSSRLAILVGTWPSVRNVVHSQNVGYLVNALVPLRASELVTVLLVGQDPRVGRLKALAAVIVDRAVDVIAVVCVFALFAKSTEKIPSAVWFGTLGVGAAMLLGLIVCVMASQARELIRRLVMRVLSPVAEEKRGRAIERLDRFIEGLSLLREKRRAAMVGALTLAFWLVSIMGCWFAVRAAWPAAPVAGTALALAMGALGTAITSAPAGIGVLHVALVFGLGLFGVPEANALAAAVTYHALSVAVSALLGFWSMRHFGLRFGAVLKTRPNAIP